MEPPPSYAYVFRNRKLPRPPLQRQDDDTYVSELHAKYWGVSINQDESEWVASHGELVENDPDGSEVVRGCFTLNFLSGGRTVSQLWVRKDYLRIYDSCDHHCQFALDKETLSPTAIITGQPGVGESFSSPQCPHKGFILKHPHTSYKQAKVIGFLMPYADALVKPNPFSGMIVQCGGICLYKMASSNGSKPWIPRCLRLTCGLLLNQVFRLNLLLDIPPMSSPYSPHFPDKRNGSP